MPKEMSAPHGTRRVPGKQHPVVDIVFWGEQTPLGEHRDRVGWVIGPGDLAKVEEARRLAAAHGELGASVPADMFVWYLPVGDGHKPWLTQIGGTPWREASKPWPRDADGVPLQFLGQISFVDSLDITPVDLPGDVLLFFGRWQDGWVRPDPDALVIEWSALRLKQPNDSYGFDSQTVRLPFCYAGAIHRSLHYLSEERADAAFRAAGFEGAWGWSAVQATSIGAYADLPQGWPVHESEGETLVASLSSYYCKGVWPLCNLAQGGLQYVRHDGSSFEIGASGLDLGFGDAGCLWVVSDGQRRFRLDAASG